MGNDFTIIDFNTTAIRVVTIDDQPWFVASDVCKTLGIANTSNALRPLPEGDVTIHQIKGQRGLPMKIISEAGLYRLVMRSDKAEGPQRAP